MSGSGAASGAPAGGGDPRALLARHGVVPKKHFGQNFLLDRNLAARIAELAAPPDSFVIEIGAGLGSLTVPLLERARHVTAIERDRDLVPALASELASSVDSGRLRIVEADAKTYDYESDLAAAAPPRAVAGNLPYQLTGPLLERLIGLAGSLERAAALVQLEVADRLAAKPGSEAYGALSVFAQAAFEVTRPLLVRRGAFFPQPNVDSALVVLVPHREPAARETAAFRQLVKGAFSQRRKKLRNAWAAVLDPAELARAAARAGIDLDRRGETLSVAEFARMTAEIDVP
ncbi:MAG TPA: 16S rRNA (adenine(1518)-N(6)/adenine(1519)-N(6))-dimethyltransferase RsmA [Polyangiaceae bacterium]